MGPMNGNDLIKEVIVKELRRQSSLSRYGTLVIRHVSKREEEERLHLKGTIGIDALSAAVASSSPTHHVVDKVLCQAGKSLDEMVDSVREYIRQAFAIKVQAMHALIESQGRTITDLRGRLEKKSGVKNKAKKKCKAKGGGK